MAETEQQATKGKQTWTQKQVYTMSAICVVLGLLFGYFFRGTESSSAKATMPAAASQASSDMPPQAQPGAQNMPSMEDMKRMADKAAEPLLAQLKADPKNADLLTKVGKTYENAHQFKEAANYYEQALALSPKDVGLRDEAGESLYYAGEVDQAIKTLEAGLAISPNDPALLVDLGLIKIRNKGDSKAAIELWQRLLKTNPNIPANKKTQIEKMIAEAKSGKPKDLN
jgi:tetratricopeptide (TPR) repeat protein